MRKTKPIETEITDAVVLVPGLIGFSRVGRFHYFSERIAAALRATLEKCLGCAVVVVPADSQPVDSLAVRQMFLLEQLRVVCCALPRLHRLHLVGHSTGGVDAQLLTCDRPIGDRSWSEFDHIRCRIASVVAIAAPLRGTFISRSLGARFVGNPLRYFRGFGTFIRLVTDVVPVVLRHPATTDLVAGITQQLPETMKFLKRVWEHRELIEELDPEPMAALHARVLPEKRVPLTSFVSVAGLSEDAPNPPDPLFRDLYDLIASHAVANLPGLAPALERLRAHRNPIVGDATLDPTMIDARTSDGVVSSGLQLFDPADPDELGGIVVGDHADVIGHYDRKPALLDETPLNVGILHSGSGFNDHSFFELYGRVVAAILRTIPELGDRPLPNLGSDLVEASHARHRPRDPAPPPGSR